MGNGHQVGFLCQVQDLHEGEKSVGMVFPDDLRGGTTLDLAEQAEQKPPCLSHLGCHSLQIESHHICGDQLLRLLFLWIYV